ncbi:ABC transporter permease [Gloeobacter violaceus]|nr:ABC transporter permease [Gloeobacter violaceus]
MRSHSGHLAPYQRIYAQMLMVLPGDFRREYGEPMLQMFSERYVEECRVRGQPGATWFWVEALFDLVRVAVFEHFGMLLQDLTYAVRMLRSNPLVTGIMLLVLALGIGANTAIFSVINAVLLRPFPYAQPERLVFVWEKSADWEKTTGMARMKSTVVSVANYLDWRAQNQVFTDMAIFNIWSGSLTGAGEPEVIDGAIVSANFFSVLGIQPQLGRSFLPEEDSPEADGQVIVISDGLWKRRFAADLGIIGRKVAIDARSYTVVGVMPSQFQQPESGFSRFQRAQIWRPLANRRKYFTDAQQCNRACRNFRVIARLKSGGSLAEAQTQMDTIARRLERTYPETNTGYGVTVIALAEQFVGNLRPILLLLTAAVGCVLLIACANVANLLLVRASARRKEIALRLALGANRARLLRQLLTESLLLSLLGGVFGVGLAWWSVPVLLALRPENLPRFDRIEIDGTVLAFGLGLSLLTGLIFGLLPALQATRTTPNAVLKEGSTTSAPRSQARWLGALVIVEIALSLALLAGAGLLVQNLLRLQSIDPGFTTRNVVSFWLALPKLRYSTDERIVAFEEQLLSRLQTLPGVEAAGRVSSLPLTGLNNWGIEVTIAGRPRPAPGQELNADNRIVSSGYFETLGIALVRGRLLNDRDRSNTPKVVLINETMAKRYWPGQDPIGQRISLGDERLWQIVGIVKDIYHFDLFQLPYPEVYTSYRQYIFGGPGLVVRGQVDPASLVQTIQQTVHSLDKNLPLNDVQTLDERLARSLAAQRFYTLLLVLMAVIAAVLAGSGLYGVMSYSVTRRTRELGIRVALGARPADVLRLVVGQGIALVLAGIGCGLILVLGAANMLTGILYEPRPQDWLALLPVTLGLFVVGLLACYVPARRATRVDSAIALRCE